MSLDSLQWLCSLAQWKGKERFGLDRIRECHRLLGNPGDRYRTIHVAGTNGKGSVSCLSASILGQLGSKVGLFTSPHLVSMNERIVIDGESVRDYDLAVACDKIRHIGDLADQLSFFEAITLASFLIFESARVDYAVIEVGLGGRLDSTNVLSAPCSTAITTIDFDHENILGNSLGMIATEKAGIIKQGSPLVVGAVGEEAADAIARVASSRGVVPRWLGRDFFVDKRAKSLSINGRTVSLLSSLFGDYQLDNAAVAVAAVEPCLGFSGLTDDLVVQIEKGLRSAYWPNRIECIVWRDKSVLIDSAHNPAGISALISFLDTQPGCDTALLFSAIDTKRWDLMIEQLSSLKPSLVVLTPPDFAGMVSPALLTDKFASYGIKTITCASLDDAAAKLSELPHQRVVCCGSMYMTGPLRAKLGIDMKPRWIRAPKFGAHGA